MENNKQYIVKSHEEECGTEYWVVTTPANVPRNKVFEVFNMARRYAEMDPYLDEEEGIKKYDERYLEMAEIFEDSNGMYAFQRYLEMQGYEVAELDIDFEYWW